MARENQGLQIALIVFVMLTIILGVTTYLFFRQYEEASIKANKNATDLDKATKLAAKNEEDVNTLKKLIGVAATEKVDAINTTTFNDDMKKYAGGYPEESRFYRPLLGKMANTIGERNSDLDIAKAKIAKLEADFATREAGKQPQIDDFKKAREEASKDLTAERGKFKSDRDRIAQDQIKLKADLENARKDAAAALTKIEQQLQDTVAQGVRLKTLNKALTNEKQQLVATKFEIPAGEIRWVNQRTGTAWIDLGRADGLQRQITFGVYPADTGDTTVGKKGSIEVTQVLGDHLAEVRLFDDKLIDPVMPGDKIYTPVWIPGEKRHFALAGFLDVHGDGKNDTQAVKDLITMNGGVVDCYLDEKGKKVGDMTVNTRFLVLGDAPSEKGQSGMIGAFTKLLDEAERLGVQRIQLRDMLHRMGWKNPTPILHYGRGANPSDFAAKPGTGPQRESTGNISDVFQKREPPARLTSPTR
jgi:hypothetical protein